MQEIRRVLNGRFLALDVVQERLDFFHPDGIRFPAELGFLEVPLERFPLDFQCFQAPLEFIGRRLADLCDFPFQFFEFGFCFQDFFRKQRWILMGGFHRSWWVDCHLGSYLKAERLATGFSIGPREEHA